MHQPPPGLDALTTPSLLLDADRVRANVAAMADAARAAGVPLRVHLKTAKCAEVAAILRDAGVTRFAVSTLAEAAFFAACGYDDLLYTTPTTPQKVAALVAAGASGVVETLAMAQAVDAAARALGHRLPVMIELDLDGNRGGVPFPGPAFEALATFVAGAGSLRLIGAMSYSGATYATTDPEGHRAIAAAHDAALAEAGARLRALGVAAPVLSSGGTPGVLACATPRGITEFRPGVFVFGDLFQAGLGVCREADIAISVLATVLSVRPDRGTALVDAGALALSLDRSTARQPEDWGLGRVCDAAGQPLGVLRVVGASQEHGTLGGDAAAVARLEPGQLVRILPNHCCLTAAAFPDYAVLDGGRLLAQRWQRVNGW